MRLRVSFLALVLAALAAPAGLAAPKSAPPAKATGPGDAVVVAVLDSAFSPYHWDFAAAQMPQALNKDRTDDLPLTRAPHTWLPGFPKPSQFSTYQPLKLSLTSDPDDNPAGLDSADADTWDTVKPSFDTHINYYWLPGTKVIGALSFNAENSTGPYIHGTTDEHGMGTTSVSVGNIHGTCPECLLVFIQYGDNPEAAISWAMHQPWIDVITNSYGISATPASRDRVYAGSDTALQKAASDRGQTIFFSAGNGQENAFTVPNSTLESSQEGPDWIVTVGATAPKGDKDYTGTGKPADVAGVGQDYPSAYGAKTVTADGPFGFGGTSNATPTLAGTYGRALYLARRAMSGGSRVQAGGLVGRGAYRCGSARPACELRDGRLSATELRLRVLRSATPTNGGYTDGATGTTLDTPSVFDTRFASEGHGTYRARVSGTPDWLTEFNRIWGPLSGRSAEPARPAGEVEWFRVDSWCRQHIWGSWSGGYYLDDARTPLPADDPVLWPTRTAYRHGCAALQKPPG